MVEKTEEKNIETPDKGVFEKAINNKIKKVEKIVEPKKAIIDDKKSVTEIVEEKKKQKEISDEEKITILGEKMFSETKKSGKLFITMNDKARNFWNSSDGSGVFISQGRCREMPEEITEVLKHALSEDNKLLREATDIELLEEMRFRAREHLITIGEISAKTFKEQKLKI